MSARPETALQAPSAKEVAGAAPVAPAQTPAAAAGGLARKLLGI